MLICDRLDSKQGKNIKKNIACDLYETASILSHCALRAPYTSLAKHRRTHQASL
jgi:hypothetical protein